MQLKTPLFRAYCMPMFSCQLWCKYTYCSLIHSLSSLQHIFHLPKEKTILHNVLNNGNVNVEGKTGTIWYAVTMM